MLSAFAGGRLLGARHGADPAQVVALHGWARTHRDFDAVLGGLDAVAPDLPGFGATAAPAEAWDSEAYAEALAPLLEEQGQPVVLVGHSFGGRVALMLAASRPELVRSLILSAVPLLLTGAAPKPARSLRLAKALNRAALISDARIEALRRRSGPPDYRNATGVMRDVFVRVVNETSDGTYTRALTNLACPIEMLWGGNDTAASPEVARAAQALVSEARLTVLPGVGHLTPTEAPAELRAAIERQLELR